MVSIQGIILPLQRGQECFKKEMSNTKMLEIHKLIKNTV